MAQNTYREPNVYTTTKRVTPIIQESPVDMYPLVIGTGQTSMTKEDVGYTVKAKFTKNGETGEQTATGEYEDIVFEDKVSDIVSAYCYDAWGDTKALEATTDYTFSKDANKVSLVKDSTKFTLGDIIYFTYITEADETRYELQRFTSDTDIANFYGADVINGKINNISLGAQMVYNAGSDVVYVLQVKTPSGDTTLAEAYKEALEENVVDLAGQHIWRICPVDKEVDQAIRQFVNEMSLPEERSEKFGTVNCEIPALAAGKFSGAFEDKVVDETNTPGLLTVYQNLINKFVNRGSAYRFQTFYPSKASYIATDGSTYDVGGEIIGCAYAGMEQSLERRSQSATNSVIPAGLLNLKPELKLRRKQKNLLAERGVTLLTQQTEYGEINVRDALSMDMSTYQTQDPCITMAADYTAKSLRQVLGVYIGKSNVTPEVIAKVRASAETTLQGMVSSGIILSYTIVDIQQDTDNPMCLVLNLRIGVSYPLKEIDVNIILD